MNKKIIKIGDVEFFEDETPETGAYIFCSSKILQVCQRKNGGKYGKVVARGKRLECRGRFSVHNLDFVRRLFDFNYVREGAEFREHDIIVKNYKFESFVEDFSRAFNYPPDVFKMQELSERFDEWKEKYPLFKMWVESLERRRRDKFDTAYGKAAAMTVWDQTW